MYISLVQWKLSNYPKAQLAVGTFFMKFRYLVKTIFTCFFFHVYTYTQLFTRTGYTKQFLFSEHWLLHFSNGFGKYIFFFMIITIYVHIYVILRCLVSNKNKEC